MTKLPRPLAAALGRWHDRHATRTLVAALEAHGREIRVIRLQLGDPRAAGFGEVRVIYQTPGAESEDNHAG